MICELMCICATIVAIVFCVVMSEKPHNHDHRD